MMLETFYLAALVTITLLCGIYAFFYCSSFGLDITWFFTAFIFTSNVFFPIGTGFGDRLAYTPSLGMCIVVALLFEKVSQSRTRHLIQGVMLALCTLGIASYLPSWQNDEALLL